MFNHLDIEQCDYLNHLQNGECVHDPLMPFTYFATLGYFLIIIILGLSTVGGLGGGIEKIPILIVMLNYSQSKATIYVYVLTFGTNLVNFIMLLFQQHPLAKKQIIDYELTLILLPTALFGSAFGNVLHHILPNLLLIIILIIFLSLFVPKLYSKAQSNEDPVQITETQPIIRNYENSELFEYYVNEDQQKIPLYKFLLLFIIFLFVQCVLMIRGGKLQRSILGIQFCSNIYWLFTLVIVVCLMMISYGIKYHLGKETSIKQQIGYFNQQVDFDFNEWKFFLIVWCSGFFGGMMGGMTGVGAGAIIVSVLMLQNVNSRVASATGGFQKLFISLFTTILSYQQGDLTKEEITFFLILGLCSGLLIAGPLYYYLKLNPSKNNLVIYIVCLLLIVSAASGVLYIVREIIFRNKFQEMIKTSSFC